jgi:hypothetical protein
VEGAGGDLFHLPARVLFEPVVVPAFGAAIAQARSAACFVRGVVLEIAAGRGTAAGRPGAGGVPDLREVPELGPRVVGGDLVPVVAVLQSDRVQRDDQGPLPWDPGGEPPGAVAAGWPGLARGSEGKSPARGAPGLAGRVVAGEAARDRGAVRVSCGSRGVCGCRVRGGRIRGRWRVLARR